MKTCFKCNEEKPLDEFYKHPGMKDGRVNKCKECNRGDVRKNRAKKVDYYREYDRQRYQNDPSVRERIGKVSKKWRKKNPKKAWASHAVNNAVRDGRLIKPEHCETCGTHNKLLHGHHSDYDRPLDVMWLCAKCHSKWHKQNGEGINA